MADHTQAQTWIDQQKDSQGASLKDPLEAIAEAHRNKLWHQLTESLSAFLELDEVKSNEALLRDITEKFVKKFQNHINPLRLARMATSICNSISVDSTYTQTYIESICECVADAPDALLLARSTLASIKLDTDAVAECREMLFELQEMADDLTAADSCVYSSFYHVSSRFQKAHGTPEQFYKNGLMYLMYTPASLLSHECQCDIAFDLCIASLIAENVYSFGELLIQSVVKELEETERGWAVKVVRVFNNGDIAAYEALQKQYAQQMNAQSALVASIQPMKEKISVLCLMELVFKRPSNERTIAFDEMAAVTKIALSEVEHLLMKALAAELVKGEIDQVQQTVTFSWVQPRALDLPQIAGLRDRLAAWQEKTATTLTSIEGHTHELFV